jgi:hypothetical protein
MASCTIAFDQDLSAKQTESLIADLSKHYDAKHLETIQKKFNSYWVLIKHYDIATAKPVLEDVMHDCAMLMHTPDPFLFINAPKS